MNHCISRANTICRLFGLAMLLGLLLTTTANGQPPKLEISPDTAQLVDQTEFDRIYLDEFNDYATMDIVPPEKVPSRPLPKTGMLVFEWVEDDEFKLDAPWGNIVDYKTFNDLLLEEADMLFKEKNYARAFRNLLYVYDHGEKGNKALEEQLQKILILDGKQNYDNGNFSLALSIFEDVHRRRGKERKRINNVDPLVMIMRCYDLMIEKRFDKGDFEGVRAVLDAVFRHYGKDVDPLKDRWTKRLTDLNQEYVAEARDAMSKSDAKAAHAAARRAIYALPDDESSNKLLNEVIERYPLVYVGVSQTAPNGGDPTNTANWAARRMGRLTQRTIVEFDGLSDEGGRYNFLNGTLVRVDDEGLNYQFQISDDDHQFGIPSVSAFQISQQLLDRADPNSPLYYEPWAKVAGPIAIDNPTTVSFRLRIPFVRPEALLQVPYERPDEDGKPIQNGPYIVTSHDTDMTAFAKNPMYKANPTAQYPEMVELKYDNPSEAVDAIIKGDIDVIDRVPIQDLRKLSRNPNIQLRKYIVPTVHMLVPNIRNDFTRNFDFRSGLLRGINRELILNDSIAAGREVTGCEILNGPFPIGSEDNDQIGYAYNPKVPLVNYDKILASVLVRVVQRQLEDKAKEKRAAERASQQQDQPPADDLNKDQVIKIPLPELVLAFPKGELPRVSCTAIARMWSELGIKVKLRELPEGQTAPEDDDYDFLYVEVAMSEPLTDVESLFGNNGIAKNLSAPVQQLVRKLSYSTSWQGAGRNLRQMHRQVLNNVSVIPLYQVQEYFAYRKNVKNLGRDLVNLYENIDQWEVVPWATPSNDK